MKYFEPPKEVAASVTDTRNHSGKYYQDVHGAKATGPHSGGKKDKTVYTYDRSKKYC